MFFGCAKKEESDETPASATSADTDTNTTATYSRTSTPAKSTVAVPASLSGTGSSSGRTPNAENCEGCDSAMLYSNLKMTHVYVFGVLFNELAISFNKTHETQT